MNNLLPMNRAQEIIKDLCFTSQSDHAPYIEPKQLAHRMRKSYGWLWDQVNRERSDPTDILHEILVMAREVRYSNPALYKLICQKILDHFLEGTGIGYIFLTDKTMAHVGQLTIEDMFKNVSTLSRSFADAVETSTNITEDGKINLEDNHLIADMQIHLNSLINSAQLLQQKIAVVKAKAGESNHA